MVIVLVAEDVRVVDSVVVKLDVTVDVSENVLVDEIVVVGVVISQVWKLPSYNHKKMKFKKKERKRNHQG